jgi:hypothetical protein
MSHLGHRQLKPQEVERTMRELEGLIEAETEGNRLNGWNSSEVLTLIEAHNILRQVLQRMPTIYE